MSKPPAAGPSPRVSSHGKTRQDQRQQRLANALRANLHRRKAQAAGQAQTGLDGPPAAKPSRRKG